MQRREVRDDASDARGIIIRVCVCNMYTSPDKIARSLLEIGSEVAGQ